MGSIYKVATKWRVQFRHKGFSPVSGYFLTYEKTKSFHDKIEEEIQKLKDDMQLDNALEKIK